MKEGQKVRVKIWHESVEMITERVSGLFFGHTNFTFPRVKKELKEVLDAKFVEFVQGRTGTLAIVELDKRLKAVPIEDILL